MKYFEIRNTPYLYFLLFTSHFYYRCWFVSVIILRVYMYGLLPVHREAFLPICIVWIKFWILQKVKKKINPNYLLWTTYLSLSIHLYCTYVLTHSEGDTNTNAAKLSSEHKSTTTGNDALLTSGGTRQNMMSRKVLSFSDADAECRALGGSKTSDTSKIKRTRPHPIDDSVVIDIDLDSNTSTGSNIDAGNDVRRTRNTKKTARVKVFSQFLRKMLSCRKETYASLEIDNPVYESPSQLDVVRDNSIHTRCSSSSVVDNYL